MSLQITAAAAVSLYKRSNLGVSEAVNVITKRSTTSDGNSGMDAANTAWFVFAIADILILVPVVLFLSYTLSTLLPALAAVEEDDVPPPAYQPVSLKDDSDVKKLGVTSTVEESERSARRGPVTAGVWATTRFLYASGGWQSFFRGYRAAIVLNFARMVVGLVAFSLVPTPVLKSLSFIAADLATVQLSTLWLHAAISTGGSPPKSLWRRLPGFRAAFRATAPATLAMDVALVLASFAGDKLYAALGVKEFGFGFETPHDSSSSAAAVSASASASAPASVAGLLAALLFQTLLFLAIAVPANVVLYRCQASLLPADEDTVVPCDRALGLESVRAKGYASACEAFRSVSRAAWARVALLYVKVIFITIVTEVAAAGVIVAQSFLVMALARKNGN